MGGGGREGRWGTLQMAQPRGGGGEGRPGVRWDLGIGEGCPGPGQLSAALRAGPGVANPTSPGRAENGLSSAWRPGAGAEGRNSWPIWSVEEEQFDSSRGPHQSPNPTEEDPGRISPGRGDCLSLAKEAPGSGTAGRALRRGGPGDAAGGRRAPGARELARGPSSALRWGLGPVRAVAGQGWEGGAAGFKRMDQKTHGGDGRGEKGGYKKKTRELQSIKLLA